MEETVLLYTK